MKKRVSLVSKVLQMSSLTVMTLLSSGAEAKISPLAFNKITTSYFKEGKEWLSPTFGAAAVMAGLPLNLRLMGHFTSGFKDGKREYTSDKSTDPTWNLLKALFPSPAGHLATETSSKANFSRYATPQIIAVLLNYVNALGEAKDKKAVKQKTLEVLVKLISSEEDVEIGRKIQSTIDTFSKENEINITKDNLLQKLTDLKTGINFGATEIQDIVKSIKRKKPVDAFKIFQANILKGKLEAINSVLNPIEKSLFQEGKGIYPEHTTAQMLTAFFCEKFNDEDIVPFLKNLDDTIIRDKNAIPQQIALLKEKDLEEHAKKGEYDLDDLFLFTLQSMFHPNIPFKSGETPVSHGPAYYYDRSNDQLNTSKTHQDCVEIAARERLAMLFYDYETETYDLNPIKTIETPYIKNMLEYFTKYSPAQANNGDISPRSDFIKVVGDLNDKKEETNQIKYKDQGTNELHPGFINSIRVFEKILGLKLPSLAEAKSQKKWVTSSFETIFKTLNPKRTYEIDLENFEEEDKEFFGALNVKVSEGTNLLFSFVENHSPRHAFINNIWDEKQETAKKSEEKIDKVEAQDTAEIFWLLASTGLQERHVNIPLYKLFSAPLQDNEKRTDFLTHLEDLASTNNEFIQKNTAALQSMLSHVLESIGWEDPIVYEAASSIVFDLIQSENLKDFHDILYTKVKSLWLKENSDLLKNFKNLEILDVSTATVKNLKLESFQNLKKIKLAGTTHLKKVTFSEANENLISVDFNGAFIEEIEKLDLLTMLNNASFKNTNKLKKITLFEKNKNLENISFSNSKIEKIEGLDQLPNLKMADFRETKKLKEVIFSQKNKNLEEVILSGSHIKILSIPHLPQKNVLIVDVTDAQELETLQLHKEVKPRLILKGMTMEDKRIKWLDE